MQLEFSTCYFSHNFYWSPYKLYNNIAYHGKSKCLLEYCNEKLASSIWDNIFYLKTFETILMYWVFSSSRGSRPLGLLCHFFVFVFVNMGPSDGIENFKKLFHNSRPTTFSNILPRCPHFLNFENWNFNDFVSLTAVPMRVKISKWDSSYKSQTKVSPRIFLRMVFTKPDPGARPMLGILKSWISHF